jgi:hypothetical protein
MINVKPMGLTSTPLISYHDINVKETDLFEDAWGLNSGYCDVIQFLGEYKPEPGKQLVNNLIELIRDSG